MYVDSAKTVRRGKTYYRHLLRDSYRENGKVKHHTIANLSKCSEEEIEAIKLALKYKGRLFEIGSVHNIHMRLGMRIGAVCFLRSIAERVHLINALGNGREATLALWQIFARLIDRRSGLSAAALAQKHSAHELIGLKPFNEDDLNQNLVWLSRRKDPIEKYIFSSKSIHHSCRFYLSDAPIPVTGHSLCEMLSCLLQKETEKYWQPIQISFDHGMNELGSIRAVEMTIADTICRKVPIPTGLCKKLLNAANVTLPLMIPEMPD